MNTAPNTLRMLLGESQYPPDPTGALQWLLNFAQKFAPSAAWIVGIPQSLVAIEFVGEPVEISRLEKWGQLISQAGEYQNSGVKLAQDDSIHLLGFELPDQKSLILALKGDGQQATADDDWLDQFRSAAVFVFQIIENAKQRDLFERRCRHLQSERSVLQSTYQQALLDAVAESDKQNERLEQLVTDRSEDLREALGLAEQANQAKTRFLANMSHEIRTPLTAIMGYTELLGDLEITDEASQWLSIIIRNSEHLLQVINEILDLSKIESGKIKIEKLPLSPKELVEQLVEVMTPGARNKSLELKVQYLTEVPYQIISDPTRLRQIITNLLSNAIKFTLKGSVTVNLSVVTSKQGQSQLRCDVIDSGIGMTQEQLKKVFSPFTQADISTTRRFGGTGLGLTISKQLAQRLGGDLTVSSQMNVGSTFTLTIPNEIPQQASESHAQSQTTTATVQTIQGDHAVPLNSPATVKTIRVLLAEDGPDNQRLICLFLKAASMEVSIAENGQIAFDKAMAAIEDNEPFDVVLMDMQMPVMDGMTATRKLREAGYQGPIVSLTANAMDSDRKRCLDAGCNDFACKPINRQELIACIEKYAQQQAAASQAQIAPQTESSPNSQEPLLSEFADDPDMAELVEDYISNMPQRVEAIQTALADQQMDQLNTLTHQLKGSAGGYGFDIISQQAGELEKCLREQAQLDQIHKQVDALLNLCNRVSVR